MRKREREQVAAVARQRLERLGAELAGLDQPLDPAVATNRGSWSGGRRPEVGASLVDTSRGDARGVSATARHGGAAVAGPPDPVLRSTSQSTGQPTGQSTVGSVPRPAGWRAVGPRAEQLSPRAPEPAPLAAPGRHLQRRGDGVVTGWLDDRLPDTLRGRVRLRPQHGPVLLALVGVALAVAGWLTLRSGANEESVASAGLVGSTALPSLAGSAAPADPTGPSATVAARPGASTAGPVVVDVAGRVRHPGIVTLPAGSRVHDAIHEAGGPRRGVALTAINLARPLVDGEQILVGRRAVPAGAAPAAAGSTPAAGALVNINSAGLPELDTLPGVGPVTAQKIVDWRSAHGAFTSVDELLEVDGIGDKTLADIAPHVTV